MRAVANEPFASEEARLDEAATMQRQLGAWFHDYNEHHPRRGLRMRSRMPFRTVCTAA
jgi:hypothetical protein